MASRFLAFLSRLRFVLDRNRLGNETSEELKLHHEFLTARYIYSGMSPDGARDAATRQLGNVTRLHEDIRDMNSIRGLDVLIQDLRYAFRLLVRNPAYAAVIIVTMALGIGANTAILSVVYAVLLEPLPYADPDEIYSVEIVIPERRDQAPSIPVRVQTFLQWRDASTVFSDMSAMRPWEASMTGDGEPERVGGARVSANYFALLGIEMSAGRGFSADEEHAGREDVVVISDGLWRRRYGSDPGVVGRNVRINGRTHAIVGIAPSTMLVPTVGELHPLIAFAPHIDIWKPIAPTVTELENESWDHGVVVRLPKGASLEQGRQQLETMLNGWLRSVLTDSKSEAIVQMVPVREIFARKARQQLLLVLAASALLLLTACASIANVVLARIASRANEFATRIALGAGRVRILSQTFTETGLLVLLGGLLGAALATYGVDALTVFGPADLRLLQQAHLSLPLLLSALAVSLSTGIACGIVPAWRAYRQDLSVALQDTTRATIGRRAERSRQLLIGVEVALATVLLASAGLLLHSFVRVMGTDRGYDVQGVLAVDLSLFGARYSEGTARRAFYGELVARVNGLPGVAAVGAVSSLPAESATNAARPTIFRANDSDFETVVLARPVAIVRSVTADYFRASGSILRAGRFLSDREGVPVAVVNESFARRLWPGENAANYVGQQFRQGSVTGPLVTVVGVIGNEHAGALDASPSPALYRPYAQWPSGPMTLVVRTVGDPAMVAGAVRDAVHRLDPDLPVSAMRTMVDVVSAAVAPRRFQLVLTSMFALVALLLGIVGIYGVVSYAVACRTREIGLRMALGATRYIVMRGVFANGMRPVLIGLVVGVTCAVAIARALRGLLFEISPSDPLAFGGIVLVLLVTSGVACYLPARRAAGLEPVIALRHD